MATAVEIRKDGSEAAQEAESAWSGRGRFTLVLLAIASLLGFVLASRNWPREHDRHRVATQVHELERSIRSHGPELWLFVEGADHARQGASPDQETRHQAMLRDFERLGRMDDLALTDVEVQVDGDKARATYRIRATTRPGERIPSGGVLEFVRHKEGWQVAGHRFVE